MTFTITPTSEHILADDYIEITFPSQFTVESTASCAALSSNISAVSCTVTNQAARIIKVGTTIDLTEYLSSKA